MIDFLSPFWLLLVLPVLALAGGYVLVQLRRKNYAARYSNVNLLSRVLPKSPGWRRHVAAGALLLCLLMLVAAAGRPSTRAKEPLERATVVLALDTSLSMKSTDVSPNRFAAEKSAAKLFVKQLPEQYNLGVVSFAKQATVKVAPTKDRQSVNRAIDGLKLQEATAIGEAVFQSLDAISSVPGDGANSAPPARVVLLSDGYTTFGRANDLAAQAAKQANVPVSTIAFGTQNGTVDIQGRSVPVPVDGTALQKLAMGTGGQFYNAPTAEELRKIYSNLGSSIGYHTVSREVTQWFSVIALLLGLAAAAMSLLWTQRLP